MQYFFFHLMPWPYGIGLAPPGYTSARSALAIIRNRNKFLAEQKSWSDMEKGVFAIVGSPETVRQQLAHFQAVG